jgi:hypothetical protein
VAFPTVPLAGDGKATAGRGGEGDGKPEASHWRALELSGGDGGGASVPKKKEVAAMLRGKAEGGGGPVEDEL